MKLLIAKAAGFCMGVRRAVDMAFDAANKHKGPVFTYGPLVHNPQVLRVLREKGISVLESIPEHSADTVLIRAHGVPPETRARLKAAGFRILDATCPRVARVQAIIKRHSRKEYACIIIGDKDHPEVVGLLGYAGKYGLAVNNLKDLEKLKPFEKAIVVAQTTQNTHFFEQVTAWVQKNRRHYKVYNTICDSTEKRQAEVQRLAQIVDAVVVVGGHNSGNTKRLAEIVRQNQKPVYHVESEADLDLEALADAEAIGITAGASTPNWVTRKVYRSLESMFYHKRRGWRRRLFQFQRLMLLTSIYVSLGAGCLTYACSHVQDVDPILPYALIAMLYVLSMHLLNNLLERKAAHYNDPDRAFFHDAYTPLLTVLALMSGAAGLSIAYIMGHAPFVILVVMSILGLSYNVTLIPPRLFNSRYRRIRDIPGSKTILIALAWGVVTALYPYLSISGGLNPQTLLIFILAALLVFVRTAFFDILDMQGDRIVGKETIAIFLGEKRSMRLLKTILVAVIIVLAVCMAIGWINLFGIALAFCPVFLLTILYVYEKGHLLPGIRLEFFVETNFLLAGIIAGLGNLLK